VNPANVDQAQGDSASVDPVEIEVGFLSDVDDLIGRASDLAVTPCANLALVMQDNPGLIPSLRGFASSLQGVGRSQAVLDTAAVKNALSDLETSMAQLDAALSQCGLGER
jgi:hypothetical protein